MTSYKTLFWSAQSDSANIWKKNLLEKKLEKNEVIFFRYFLVFLINLSRPDSRRSEKINLKFHFHTSLWRRKRFYEDLKGFHKTF